MAKHVVARFLVDHPIGAGAVRAILDTLVAQGGAYEPHLVRGPQDANPRRITWARPARLYEEVGEAGAATTFLRVAEGSVQPVLSFSMSQSPRSSPSIVTLRIPAEALATGQDIEQILGVCKGLYLFLESPWGVVGIPEADAPPISLEWATFFGAELVARLGPARLLTSMAFIVEILADGGMMVVTHASPQQAASHEGVAFRRQIEEAIGLKDWEKGTTGENPLNLTTEQSAIRGRRKPAPRGWTSTPKN